MSLQIRTRLQTFINKFVLLHGRGTHLIDDIAIVSPVSQKYVN